MNIPRKYKLYANPRWLFAQYWQENLSTIKLARMCDVAPCTIKRHMRKYEIATRTHSEAFQLNMNDYPFRTEKWLKDQYWRKGNTIRGMATLCGCDKTSIQYWMDKHNIPRRSKSEWQARMVKANRKRCRRSWYSRFVAGIRRIIKNLDIYMKEQDN